MSYEKSIQVLLKNYSKNAERLYRMEKDEVLREWNTEYTIRKKKIEPGVYSHLQQKLHYEKRQILDSMAQLRMQVELTKLLLLQLNDKDRELIQMRYLQHLPVQTICLRLFLSKSSFYRRHSRILEDLAKYYQDFMEKEHPERVVHEYSSGVQRAYL